MIRLGGVVGYAFDGPFPLSEWVAPSRGAVYAVLLASAEGRYFGTEPVPGTVLHVGHSDDLAKDRFPWSHPDAACWVELAGSRDSLAVAAFLQCPTHRIRADIAQDLLDFYEPPCGDRTVVWRWPTEPPSDDPPGGSRVPARPRPPLLPPAAAAEQDEAEDVNSSWVDPGGSASAGPS